MASSTQVRRIIHTRKCIVIASLASLAPKPRKKHRQNAERVAKRQARQEQIRLMKIAGLSYRQIGKTLGFSAQAAQAYLRADKPECLLEMICVGCGKFDVSIQGHNPDYSKHEVIRLCPKCHGQQTEKERLLKLKI